MSDDKKSPSLWKYVWPMVGAVGILATAYFGINGLIDSRIDARLRNSQLRDDIIKEVNKYLVFDVRGIVTNDPNHIYDDWIDSIEVRKVTEGNESSTVVTVKFKRLLEVEPILFNLGSSTRSIGYRVTNLEWKFHEENVLVTMSTPKRDSSDAKYLMQIFR